MTATLLTSSASGAVVLALLLFVLLRRVAGEASGRSPAGDGWAVALLSAVFVAAVVARFIHG
ncbi:MAG TPA: hypothetical protein VGM91_01000 [Conexibacter sp.]|jgi:hypothetical protein